MKKDTAVIVALTVIAVAVVAFLFVGRVHIPAVEKAESVSNGVHTELNEVQTKELCAILKGKRLYKDRPACGFEDTPYMVITCRDGQTMTFCTAFDDCPIVYYKEKNRYCRLTDYENHRLRSLCDDV